MIMQSFQQPFRCFGADDDAASEGGDGAHDDDNSIGSSVNNCQKVSLFLVTLYTSQYTVCIQ